MSDAPRYKWQPTTAEIAARYHLREDEVIRFDHNTSPFTTDWAPAVIAPLARTQNEYPGASYAPLRMRAAAFYGIEPEWVVPGAGVDEIILLIAKAFLGPTTRAVAPAPTYPLYEIATRQAGAEFRTVALRGPEFVFPVDDLVSAAATADVVWICTPNNPTGHRVDPVQVEAVVAATKGVAVIDAAYAEFVGDRWGPLLERHPHAIACHTLSKAFGLAGLRVGFGLAQPGLIDRLDGVRPPGSIASLSAALAEQALANPQRMHRHVARLTTARSRLAEDLEAIGVDVADGSDANFLLCRCGPGAGQIADLLMAEGLVVRRFPPDHPLADHLRFTVRSPEQNARLVDALRRHRP